MPDIAAIIIYVIQGGGLNLTDQTYRWMVIVGVIPAVLGVLVLLAFVHEKGLPKNTTAKYDVAPVTHNEAFSKQFKLYLAVMAIFTLGNSSDFFVILRAQNLGTNVLNITLMLVLFNITYVVTSVPSGILSDRFGRKRLIAVGWIVYALVYLGFALATSVWHMWVLFACYGVYYGIVEGATKAFVADLVPADKRGTAYGYYHGVVGLMLLPASVLAGWLWSVLSPAAPFYLGAGLAFLAMLAMLVLLKERRENATPA